MERTYISDIPKSNGKKVKIFGWVEEIRLLGKINFIVLRDREGNAQIIIKRGETNEKILDLLKDITKESVISVEGEVKLNKEAPGGLEVVPYKIDVLSKAEVPLPIDFSGKVNTTLDKRLDWRFLDLRNPKRLLIFKVLSTVEKAMEDFCFENNFLKINTPKFMEAASETGSELFEVKYFNKKAYLAQSPQFYKQMAIAAGLDKVFEQAPVFRANPSHTSRHDTEYVSFDIEMAFIESFEDLMKFEEKWIKYVIKKIKEVHGEEIKKRFGIEINIPKIPFPRITMKEAKKILNEKEMEVGEFYELSSEEEKRLGEYVKKKYGHDFVFLTEFPYSQRPFYHMKKDNQPEITLSYDLIYKGLEITTGSQREHRYEILERQAKEKGIDPKTIGFYLNFFKYGCPPHGGYALSPTRFVMKLLNLPNVRESTLLPRDTERLTP